MPSTPAFATSAGSSHTKSGAPSSTSVMPATSVNSVCTGPGHRQGGLAHVDLHAARLADLGGQRLQAILAPRHQNEVVTARGELAGELGADARRGAGDEDDGLRIGAGKAHLTRYAYQAGGR